MQENNTFREVVDLISELNKMMIIASANVEEYNGWYFVNVDPFIDMKLEPLALKSEDLEYIADELYIYYDKMKSKNRRERRNMVLGKFGLAYLYVQNVTITLLFLGFVGFSYMILYRAGLTDEVQAAAWEIIQITIKDLVSWIVPQ